MTIVLVLAALVLLIAALLLVVRMTIGPTVLDRSVALEVLVAITVSSIALYTAHTGLTYALPVLVALSGCGFVGAVSVAGYVGRSHNRDARTDSRGPGGAR